MDEDAKWYFEITGLRIGKESDNGDPLTVESELKGYVVHGMDYMGVVKFQETVVVPMLKTLLDSSVQAGYQLMGDFGANAKGNESKK